jgi:hypothetical protein
MYIYDVKYSCMCIPFINNAKKIAYYIYIYLNNCIFFIFSNILFIKMFMCLICFIDIH